MKEQKERKLTKAELERREIFEKKKESLLEQGYTYKNSTIGVVYANVMSFVSAGPLMILFCALYVMYNGDNGNGPIYLPELPMQEMLKFLCGLLICLVLHELVHGFVWGLFAKNHYKDISFGVIWSMLTPYCCCKAALKKWQYMLGSIMPLVVVGILPTVYAIMTGSSFLFWLGIFMVLGAGGDIIICLKMLFYRSNEKEMIFMDHPYECGFVVFERNSNSVYM